MERKKFKDIGSDFKHRHFSGEIIIIGCMRGYFKYPISYGNLEEVMIERGVKVDHTTIYRWIQKYAAEFYKRIRWYSQCSSDGWGLCQGERKMERSV